MSSYDQLEQVFGRAASIHDVIGILGWDTETMMPSGSIEGRSEQLATLEGLGHEIITAPAVGELIPLTLAEQDRLSDWQRANLREMERMHLRAVAVPRHLLVASTRANAICRHAWQGARKKNDFGAVKSKLEEVIRLQRETGQALGDALELGPYDALLDQYDVGLTRGLLDRLFGSARQVLPDLIQKAVERQRSNPDPERVEGLFSAEIQERLCRTVLDTIGFDFEHGRLDVSAHPFTGGSFGDVRVTTRFNQDELISAVMAAVHEGGHALYERRANARRGLERDPEYGERCCRSRGRRRGWRIG